MKKLFSAVIVLMLMLALYCFPASAAEELIIEGGDFEFLAVGTVLETEGKNKGWGTAEPDAGTAKVMAENGNKFIRIGQDSNHKYSSFFGLFKDRRLEAGVTYKCEFDFRIGESAKGIEHHYTVLGMGGTIQRVDFGKEASVTDKGNGWKHIKVPDLKPSAADAVKVDSIRFLLVSDQLSSRYIDIDNVRFVKVTSEPASSAESSSKSEASSAAPAVGSSSQTKPSESSAASVSSGQAVSEAESQAPTESDTASEAGDASSEVSTNTAASSKAAASGTAEDEGGPWLWIVVLGVLLLAGAGVLVYMLVVKRKPAEDAEQK